MVVTETPDAMLSRTTKPSRASGCMGFPVYIYVYIRVHTRINTYIVISPTNYERKICEAVTGTPDNMLSRTTKPSVSESEGMQNTP